MLEQRYCKRLIEVDLPIKKISEHARREKSIRHGHISSLHIWWARRPLAACRAIICAALWLDPADSLCPEIFRQEASRLMKEFRDKRGGKPRNWDDPTELRQALLDFIADFADWDNSSVNDYLNTSRALTQAAHDALGNNPNTKPLIIDPFAGGGSIPLEALRVGADAFASDLNPIAVLLNKVILEYIPKYSNRLAEEVNKWGEWIKKEIEKELTDYYPKDPDGSIPIAYLWARTINCEGPGCGAEVPLLTKFWLAKKTDRKTGLKLIISPKTKQINFEIVQNPSAQQMDQGLVRRGSVICPICGYTTSANNVKKQFQTRQGGVNDAMLIAVATLPKNGVGRVYRLPNKSDFQSIKAASKALEDIVSNKKTLFNPVPDEPLPYLRSIFNIHLLGINQWGQLFTHRQLLNLLTIVKLIGEAYSLMLKENPKENDLAKATTTMLAFTLDRLADLSNSLCRWEPVAECPRNLFGRQAMPIIWDFAEGVPIGRSSGSWSVLVARNKHVLQSIGFDWNSSTPVLQSATQQVLPNDCAQLFITDPPYYDLVPYADLSDFFYVWLKRTIGNIHPELFTDSLTPKKDEAVQLAERNTLYAYKTRENYERIMRQAMEESRRVLKPDGLGVVFFAHKGTEAWEAQLQSMIDAGWIITGSWPIDTECGSRLRARDSAVLASSVQLVCRPRENPDGSIKSGEIGDWRDVLQALPRRIHEWMPRLAKEGVVGADAIFACLGPALEIFSRYSSVEKANGEKVELKEYLVQVWGAVAKEALNMIFEGARTEGFEEDSRITAMWLWTLSTAENGTAQSGSEVESEENEEESTGSKVSGFTLEYDAARKIAQGLGAHLEDLESVISVNGDKATLLPVGERVQYLFGKGSLSATPRRKKKDNQLNLFEQLGEVEEQGWSLNDEKSSVGKTVLDKLHQGMILFGAGRADALRRFLVEEGIGKDERFWRLGQALSALYPTNTDEKRWIDGVLARKKSLGF